MCGFCNVWVCVCVGFVMCGCRMCGFCNLWVCVCVGFLMCVFGGGIVMCWFCNVCFGNICTCNYCVAVLFRLCIFILIRLVCTSVRTT